MYKVTTAPAAEPVTLSEAKEHLRVTHAEEDTLIATYIQAARELIEQRTNRALMTQTIVQYYDSFDTCFASRFSPVQAVVSLKYYDVDNAQQTLVLDTDYGADLVTEPARIYPILSWPGTYPKANAIELTLTAGYPTAADVPALIKASLFLVLGEMYETRENTVKRLPTAVDYFLNANTVRLK